MAGKGPRHPPAPGGGGGSVSNGLPLICFQVLNFVVEYVKDIHETQQEMTAEVEKYEKMMRMLEGDVDEDDREPVESTKVCVRQPVPH